jgi:hypothetical protein
MLPLSLCYGEPATPGAILTFYISDINLVTSHKAVMTISTAGLVDFTINGVPISGPDEMVETGIDTGVFQVQLTLPDSVNGKPLKNGDVVVMTYHQSADYSGNPTNLTQSKVLTSVPSNPVSSSAPNVRIGNYFKLRIYAPDFNLDSFHPDDIPLNMIEFHYGGLQTTLADPSFQTNPYSLRETGANTDIFEVTVKMPKEVNGFPIEMGSTLEFRFNDPNFPSSVFVTVGSSGVYTPNTIRHLVPSNLVVHTSNSLGANVNYLNSSFLSDLNSPVCDPPSGSFFVIGTTTITCAAKDINKNSVVKSFVVNVLTSPNQIPLWTKKTVRFWCDGYLDDEQLHSAFRYLVSHGIMSIQNDSFNLSQTPDKTNLCLWVDNKISDKDVITSLYLISR